MSIQELLAAIQWSISENIPLGVDIVVEADSSDDIPTGRVVVKVTYGTGDQDQ